jgi:16S rRNA (uracil1498-N3)-methyltransferase
MISTQRFYSANIAVSSRALSIIDPDELHHLQHVLRLKLGDKVEFVNGQGLLARGVLSLVTKSLVEAKIDQVDAFPRKAGPRIVLACALPKKAKFELILEKATELGVDEVVPVVTERTEVVVGKDTAERKDHRFFRVVLNACKQSRRVWFPEVHSIMPFADALKAFAGENNALFIPWLEGERRFILDALEEPRLRGAERVVFFIGPEGDFTPNEILLSKSFGAMPVSLGKNVLKVDTAALLTLSLAISKLNRE